MMTKSKECRRILASGARCHALAVKGTPYCFFHQALRDFHQENRRRSKSILVPALDDRASIQLAIGSILDAIGSSRMDPLRARAYLYGLQLAMQNLGKGLGFAASDSVQNPVCPDDGEFLAPDEDDVEVQQQPAATPACAVAESGDAENIDISAAAEEPPVEPPSLGRYGGLHALDLQDRELPEPELKQRKIFERIALNLVKDTLAAMPYRDARDRRKLREQLRSQYLTEYLAPKPEPRLCPVSTRYLAVLLA